MSIQHIAARCAAAGLFLFATSAHAADLPTAVKATHPLAYYRLGDLKGSSEVGPSQYHAVGSATVTKQGGQFAGADNQLLLLDGVSAYVEATQRGAIKDQVSIMAWVDLAGLPSVDRHFYYVAGESQYGNDLDLQFETDNQLKFYTASGGHLSYTPAPDTLPNRWHMIVATVNATTGERHIYWDGASVAADQGAKGMGAKTTVFTIGASELFKGRFLHGGVDEVALWDHALSAAEVASIYKAADPSALQVALAG